MLQNQNITFGRILHTIANARTVNLQIAIKRLAAAYEQRPQDPDECKRAQAALERAVITMAETYQDAHSRHNLLNEFGEKYPG